MIGSKYVDTGSQFITIKPCQFHRPRGKTASMHPTNLTERGSWEEFLFLHSENVSHSLKHHKGDILKLVN